jgi:hypothetical protein
MVIDKREDLRETEKPSFLDEFVAKINEIKKYTNFAKTEPKISKFI